ncbi:MAG: response regulator [Planctomycetes bacterium]|nr:response regulator [Planctomycetota bacterium]MCP4770325.1 response regulator [Planctomycetota bacterium]MCP4861499.1 response regulator [Planctomycetota bacterium]
MVDNDPGMCQLMSMAFEQAGHSVIATGTPAIAEKALESGKCAALLMDFHLGAGESGGALVASWADTHGLPPTWIVTGTPNDPRLAEMHATPGLKGVVSKPFAIMDLVARVVRALEGTEATPSGGEAQSGTDSAAVQAEAQE